MAVKSVVRKNEYRDSIQLMRVSNEICETKGVNTASILMATDNNKKILADAGLLTNEIKKAGPNDLVFAVSAADQDAIKKAFQMAEKLLGTKR